IATTRRSPSFASGAAGGSRSRMANEARSDRERSKHRASSPAMSRFAHSLDDRDRAHGRAVATAQAQRKRGEPHDILGDRAEIREVLDDDDAASQKHLMRLVRLSIDGGEIDADEADVLVDEIPRGVGRDDRMSSEIIRFPPPPVPAGVEDDAARRMDLLAEREKVIASDRSGFDGAWEPKDGGRAGAELERDSVDRVAVAEEVERRV